MSPPIPSPQRFLERILYWLPRVLAVAAVIMFAAASLDVWEMAGSFWLRLGGFVLHLVPSILTLVALVIAWRAEALGGLFFVILAIVFWLWFGNLVSTSIPLVIGLLFMLYRALFGRIG